jgi:hypothetical protein
LTAKALIAITAVISKDYDHGGKHSPPVTPPDRTTMTLPTPALIADRLWGIYSETSPRKNAKTLRLTKEQFNLLAGRDNIQNSTLVAVSNAVRKYGIFLFRIDYHFVIVDPLSILKWQLPDKKTIRSAAKRNTVNPQAPWPFSTASKP